MTFDLLRRTLLALCLIALGGTASTALGQTGSAPAAPGPLPTTLQGFSIVLVLGDLQGGPTADNVPPAARKALADMKDFLPYKSYRLIDTGWILGPDGTRAATSQLMGPANEAYEVSLDAELTTRKAPVWSALNIRFRLRDPSVRTTTHDSERANQLREEAKNARLAIERARAARLEAEVVALRQKYGPRYPALAAKQHELDTVKQQEAALENEARAATNGPSIIDTSFKMDIGETVVVGTSRVQGDKALIAILTAVPRVLAKRSKG